MSRRRIRIDLAYDGTDFFGWQVQSHGRTVQGELEKALGKIEGAEVRVIGSGRTDSGVHACFQVAHFDTEKDSIEPSRFATALNSILLKDIRILVTKEVAEDFHARFSAVERGYCYYFSQNSCMLPFYRDFCWDLRRPLNVELLNRYASKLIGLHDFTTFSAAGDASPTKERIITSASFVPRGDFLVFKLSGNAFLWKMVRSITGTMIGLEVKGAGEGVFEEILKAKERSLVGTTAPARGLFLDYVRYPGDPGGTGFEYPENIEALI